MSSKLDYYIFCSGKACFAYCSGQPWFLKNRGEKIMMEKKRWQQGIVKRYEKNPIITLDDIPQPTNSVFNAAAAHYQDKYFLLLRVEGLDGKSRFFLAESRDGIKFKVSKKAVMELSDQEPFKTYEKRGIEDPRITKIGNLYYILYVAFSHLGPRLALASTKNFKAFRRIALVSQPENKDAVLFSKKINGYFVRFDRPVRQGIWVSYSRDLISWGNSRCVMESRPGYWDSDRIGAAVPPIETDRGWLEIYHGFRNTASGKIYRLGTALFDLKDPSKLIARGEAPILSPREYYERVGDVNNVVFSCGAILEKKTQQVKIYYGACDTAICLGTADLNNLVERCFD